MVIPNDPTMAAGRVSGYFEKAGRLKLKDLWQVWLLLADISVKNFNPKITEAEVKLYAAYSG